jgi:hypothetical protein
MNLAYTVHTLHQLDRKTNMKLRCIETGRTTRVNLDERYELNEVVHGTEIRAAANRLVSRENRGYFANFGSVCINNVGHITPAEIARPVGSMTESTGQTVHFELIP